jgi:hypothetical protein
MPDLGLEAHDRRSERVFVRNLNVDSERAALVRCVWRPVELAAEVCEVIAVARGIDNDLGVLVVLDVGNLLGDAPGAVGGGHCEGCWGWGRRENVVWKKKKAEVRSRQQVAVTLEQWSASGCGEGAGCCGVCGGGGALSLDSMKDRCWERADGVRHTQARAVIAREQCFKSTW